MSWTRKLLPRSLRSRLILSFGILIFLTLFLAGSTTVLLLRDERAETARERVGRLAEPVALRSVFLEASGATAAEIETVLYEEYGGEGVRILIVDANATVVRDTGETLQGTTIAQLSDQGLRARPLETLRFRVQRLQTEPGNLLLFTSPEGIFATVPGLRGAFVPRYRAVVAIDASELSQAWRELLPRFFLAGGVSFFASVLAASLLARSITQPLRRMTTATEEMARGRYDQQIPAHGSDEVGRLATSFNEMARQVGRSHRTLREFIANVSHELKTPLTSVQGFSQAMVDGSVQSPAEFAESGRIINEEAVRMRALVDDLLYLSQVEAGEVQLQRERLSADALLRTTRARFERRAAQTNVALDVESALTPPIEADPRRLEQALSNIVENAVRHTPADGKVTLAATAANGSVALSVHNTGSLIPPAALPRIFDRFFQVDPARAQVDGSTGLGLAITREIVEAHGGTVVVTSSEADGTRFVITLPAAGPPPASTEAEQ